MGYLKANGSTPKDIRYGSNIVRKVYYGGELVWDRTVYLPSLGTTYGNGVMQWVPQVSRYIYFIHIYQNSSLCLGGFQSSDGINWKRFTDNEPGIPSAYTVYSFSYYSENTFRVKSTALSYPYHDVGYNASVWYTPLATS